MSEIHVVASMTTAAVKDILRNIWGLPNVDKTRVVTDAVDHSKLPDDCAEICSFLSDQARVVTELQALNTAIRNKLEAPGASGEVQGVRAKIEGVINRTGGYDDPTRGVGQGEPTKVFKTHKVLSGVLDEAEQAAGFNGAQAKLHTTAQTAGDKSNAIAFGAHDPQGAWQAHVPPNTPVGKLPQVNLPSAAPTLTGILIKSFNPILLKNGFHWKDPGADARIHGEFTHRLQWYAVVQAKTNARLNLINTPLQIFKSMGYLFAGADNAVNFPGEGGVLINATTKVYLWELLCDCFAVDQRESTPTKPWSETFNCPNVLQTFLSKPIMPPNQHQLPYLNVLMRARLIKRSREAPDKSETAIRSGAKPVKYGITSPQDVGAMGQGAIWWRKYA